jgi:hypothetical protein
MKVYIVIYPISGFIELCARAENADGTIGDLVETIRPGESAFGKTYEEWAQVKEPFLEIERLYK